MKIWKRAVPALLIAVLLLSLLCGCQPGGILRRLYPTWMLTTALSTVSSPEA